MIEALYRFLKSVGYEHPIHSPIVHMPIGLITGAFVFFVIAILFKRKQLVLSARHASILALAFAFPTILFGVFDWIHFYHAALIPAIKYKMVLASAVLVLLAILFAAPRVASYLLVQAGEQRVAEATASLPFKSRIVMPSRSRL